MSETTQKISGGTNKLISLVVGVAIIVGGVSFYGGMKYGQSKISQFAGAGNGMRVRSGGAGVGFGGRTAGGFVNGEILTKDSQSVTIKMRDGSSKIVFYSASTEVGKTVNGASSDLEVGKNVSVNGTPNPDGSITAQSIQLRPASSIQPASIK